MNTPPLNSYMSTADILAQHEEAIDVLAQVAAGLLSELHNGNDTIPSGTIPSIKTGDFTAGKTTYVTIGEDVIKAAQVRDKAREELDARIAAMEEVVYRMEETIKNLSKENHR